MNSLGKRALSFLLCVCMMLGVAPFAAYADEADTNVQETVETTEEMPALVTEETVDDVAEAAIDDAAAMTKASGKGWFNVGVTGDYYTVVSEKHYGLVPGAEEAEIILNNSAGNRRQVVHVFKVDGSKVDILPGYYGIDKDVTLKENQAEAKVTDTAAYYEDVLGYDLVGGMNIALSYDSQAPYSFLIYEGKVLQDLNSSDPLMNQHTGKCQTYLAIYKDGSCELRSNTEPYDGNEWHAVGANFNWLVKDGQLITKTPERTSSPASRSMLGILPDGSLIMCMVDGRGANNSVGLSNYEMGEFMLALGCVNAVNGDGGGSSTFISRREGESELTMRSVPSDGSERPTLHSVFLAKKEGVAPGTFDHANVEAAYDYYVPGITYSFGAVAIDTTGAEMAMPEGGVWSLSDDSFGTIDANGTFTSNGTLGEVDVCYSVNETVAQKSIVIANPTVAAFATDSTVLPYGKSTPLTLNVWADNVGEYPMYFQADSFDWSTTDANAGTLDLQNMAFVGTSDESVKGVVVKAVYKHAQMAELSYTIDFGKGSEIIFDFEDGDVSDWMGFDEAKQWSVENGVNNTLVGTDPLAGQFSGNVDGYTGLATAGEGQVKNGNYALAWTLDNTDADFAGWTYNVLFNVADEPLVLRDVANGKNATTLGMWLYIPEGATGLAFQSQLYVKNADGSYSCKQDHFMFETVSGVRKNLNSCTEADIPQSRWVYASIDISKYDYLCMPVATDVSNSRSPSFVRTYIKPMNPAVHTFYIDDITLDYSSAVDDREAPVIGEIKYATADESVKAEGATIAANTASFSATVADYTKNNSVGLNTATAQIYIDGNMVDTEVSGGYMTAENVKLENGAHVVTFEIADNLGNYAQSSASFTVAYSEEKSLVYVTGHNDSGAKPEVDSVYYVDIKTTDIGEIDNAEVNIKLNSANTWELENMIVAPGFRAEYEILSNDNSYAVMATSSDIHSTDNVAVVTITKTGDCPLTGEQTLVSLPVRVWSWNEESSGITAVEQFKTGYCPIVTIDYDVLFGYAEDTSGNVVSFGGSASVETMINDAENPWHVHTVVALEDKAATCTENGYTGRTYCYDCSSVIAWGTTVACTGHSDEYDYYSGVLACPNCGVVENVTGLIEHNGYTYYAIAGNLQNRWQQIDNDWYFFYPDSFKGANGALPGGPSGFTFNYTMVNGKIQSGVWCEINGQYRYYYGPDYYRTSWQTIDGEKYYFDNNGYRLTGYNLIKLSRYSKEDDYQMYLFAEDGMLLETLTHTGLLEANGNIYYLVNGIGNHAGLIKIGEDYYYINGNYMAVTGEKTINEPWDNDLLPCGTYVFGEDGKMIIEEEEKLNGIVGDYYYIDGEIQKPGLIQIDGAYYYFSTTNGVMSRNVTKMIYRIHESCDLPQGEYTFGADGKIIFPTKNGIVGDYYYVDDVIQKPGLIKIGEDYYYFSTTNGVMSRNVTKMIYRIHESCDLPQGEYTFGADGKVIFPEEEVLNGIVGDYYYIDGEIQKPGLIKIGEDYYYFSTTNGVMSRNVTKMIYRIHESCDLPQGEYTFGADGKIVF